MKKLWCLLLSALLLLSLVGCDVITYSANTSVRIVYSRGSVSFDDELTKEEAATVLEILNGKRKDLDLFVTEAACPFGPEQAIVIGDTTYYLAQDGCAVLLKAGTKSYYHFSEAERETLEQIFKAHGADEI